MTTSHLVAGIGLIAIGLMHSALGEIGILRPLFRASWAVDDPRWAVERILRFAWHLTTIAWFGLAAIVLGASAATIVAIVAALSAVIIFVTLRGHLAWPMFALVALAAWWIDGPIPDPVLRWGTIATVTALTVAAAVHVYWAAGGRWGIEVAVPTTADGDTAFTPPPLLTLGVAGLLAGFAALVAAAATGWGPSAIRWLVVAGIAVLTVRAIGDGRTAGFTKTLRTTKFAQADDRIFTPLIVFLVFGAGGALLAA
ncbi:MAG: DUF3995 domain-containing protein [Actinomycetota bacterium]